jgi:hypothetical protein
MKQTFSGVAYFTFKTALTPSQSSRLGSSTTKQLRTFSCCPQLRSDAPITEKLSPRWLSDLKSRIGRCIQFGLTQPQVREAGQILHDLSHDWRELVAGSEGFLTSEDRRGLFRQDVVWGEMVGVSEGASIDYLCLFWFILESTNPLLASRACSTRPLLIGNIICRTLWYVRVLLPLEARTATDTAEGPCEQCHVRKILRIWASAVVQEFCESPRSSQP